VQNAIAGAAVVVEELEISQLDPLIVDYLEFGIKKEISKPVNPTMQVHIMSSPFNNEQLAPFLQ